MSVEFSFPTLAYGIEILLFLLVCGVQELRVDCDRVSSLILNLRQPVANSGGLNGPFPSHRQARNYRAGRSCLSGLESRIPLSMYVANITRASETRGAQFHSREHMK